MARIDTPPAVTVPRERSDSGSSHGSSPRRPAKKPIRSFSPTSDDDNLQVPVLDDDTPPPEDRPFIRQSLGAFGGTGPGAFGSTSTSASTAFPSASASGSTASPSSRSSPFALSGNNNTHTSPSPSGSTAFPAASASASGSGSADLRPSAIPRAPPYRSSGSNLFGSQISGTPSFTFPVSVTPVAPAKTAAVKTYDPTPIRSKNPPSQFLPGQKPSPPRPPQHSSTHGPSMSPPTHVPVYAPSLSPPPLPSAASAPVPAPAHMPAPPAVAPVPAPARARARAPAATRAKASTTAPSAAPVPETKKKSRARKPKDNFAYQTNRFRMDAVPAPAAPLEPPSPPRMSTETPGPYSAQFRTENYSHTPHRPPESRPSGYTHVLHQPPPAPPPARASRARGRENIILIPERSPSPMSYQEELNEECDYSPDLGLQQLSEAAAQKSAQIGNSVGTSAEYGQQFNKTSNGSSYRVLDMNHRSLSASTSAQLPRSETRTVYLLITDYRGGMNDQQYVEVGVVLYPGKVLQDGWIANSIDICGALQESAGKIDGPAKVSCQRGVYKHPFFRITDEDAAPFCPAAEIKVPLDYKLKLSVDEIGPPRAKRTPTPPPRRSSHRRSYSPDSDYSHHDRDRARDRDREHRHSDRRRDSRGSRHRKRRYAKSSSDSEDHHYDRNLSHTRTSSSTISSARYESYEPSSPHRSRPREPEPRKKRSRRERDSLSPPPSAVKISSQIVKRGPPRTLHEVVNPRFDDLDRPYNSPTQSDEEEDINQKMTQGADCILQLEPNWTDFYKSKTLKGRAQDVLRQYEIVHDWLLKHSGITPPFSHSPHLKLTDAHICGALLMDEPEDWAVRCREAMELLSLYGPEGSRVRDPRVAEALAVEEYPLAHQKPMKVLVRLMRETDKEWKQNNPRL